MPKGRRKWNRKLENSSKGFPGNNRLPRIRLNPIDGHTTGD
jgi:hypothetical protein